MRAVSTRPGGSVARGAREPRGRRVIAQLLVAFAIALGGERAGAQQAPAAAPAKPDAPRAVRLQEIPDQLEHDEAELERIERRIAATADLEAVQASLVEVLADVEAHQGEDLAQIERARTGRALDAVASAWVQRRTQISGIEQTLFAASSVLARELAELLELRGRSHGPLRAADRGAARLVRRARRNVPGRAGVPAPLGRGLGPRGSGLRARRRDPGAAALRRRADRADGRDARRVPRPARPREG